MPQNNHKSYKYVASMITVCLVVVSDLINCNK